jgi:uncharacterized membrane protein YhaH (DUF805 family)
MAPAREGKLPGILASIRHGFAGLLRFSGRDTQREFWPYAIFLFVLSSAAGMVLAMFMMAEMFARVQRYVIDHPEGLPPPVPGHPALPPELMPDMAMLAGPMAVVNFVIVLLIAAAVARRLHDRDRTGLWGLMPLPFMIVGLLNREAAVALATGQRPPDRLEALMFMTTPLYWLAFIALIVLLIGEGTKGSNRFGPEPAPKP